MMTRPIIEITPTLDVLDRSTRAYNTPIGRLYKKGVHSYGFSRRAFTLPLTEAQEYELQWAIYELEKNDED